MGIILLSIINKQLIRLKKLHYSIMQGPCRVICSMLKCFSAPKELIHGHLAVHTSKTICMDDYKVHWLKVSTK